jgi:hypothetical protein
MVQHMEFGRQFLLQFWGHFYYKLEESYKYFTFANTKRSQYGPESIGDEVGRAQLRDGCQKLIALP